MLHLFKKKKNQPKRLVAFLRLAFCLLFILTAGQAAFAQTPENPNRFAEYLAKENLKLSLQLNQTKNLTDPVDQADWEEKLKANKLKKAFNQSKINSFEDALNHQQDRGNQLARDIKQLQHQVIPKNQLSQVQLRLSKLETLLTVNKTTIELINNNLNLANQYQHKLQEESKRLAHWKAHQSYHEQQSELDNQVKALKVSLNQYYQKNIELQQAESQEPSEKKQLADEIQLYLNNLQISFIQQDLKGLGIERKIHRSDYLYQQRPDSDQLLQAIHAYDEAIVQNNATKLALQKLGDDLNQQANLLEHKAIQTLQQEISSRLKAVDQRITALTDQLSAYQQTQKNQMASRQSLSIYRLDHLTEMLSEMFTVPGQLYAYLKALVLMNHHNYTWKAPWPKAFFWFSLCLVAGLAYALHFSLSFLLKHNKERSRLTGYLYDGSLTIIKRNLPHLTVLALLSTCFFLNRIGYSNYQLIIQMVTVYLTFRSMIIVARLSLLERISDATGQDVKLYYRLKWLLLAGGWTTSLMVLSHKLQLSLSIQDLFNRLFMLFILAVSVVAWRSRDILPDLLKPYLVSKKRYYQNAVKLLVELLPFTLLTTASLGLLGYINLAWTMSQYQAFIVLMLSSYVLIRGLLLDALELLSEWMISSLDNGWLWIEVALKPLDKILRTLIFLSGVLFLFQILGATSNEKFMAQVHQIASYPIINISGVHITLMSIAEFTVLLSVFVWAAKWTREFCYRWLFRNAKDAGIRNSLSVFSQYAVILIGSFITLRVLGLDFSGMSMILGGLAVGMGFGLRDFASNVIGGLMLLIERPVREGDIITLGEFEGKVSHIGIRSMRVTSWDNMDVLIPNAETFNKPFINWTHQDNIVRTVIPVKVSRSDDPVLVQQIIIDTMAIIPEILTEPVSQVLIREVADALIIFEIRYFMDVELYSRVEVQSKFLFELTAQFKKAGIKAPIPPIHIDFEEKTSDQPHRKTTTEIGE